MKKLFIAIPIILMIACSKRKDISVPSTFVNGTYKRAILPLRWSDTTNGVATNIVDSNFTLTATLSSSNTIELVLTTTAPLPVKQFSIPYNGYFNQSGSEGYIFGYQVKTGNTVTLYENISFSSQISNATERAFSMQYAQISGTGATASKQQLYVDGKRQ